jgi:hypothetical protein
MGINNVNIICRICKKRFQPREHKIKVFEYDIDSNTWMKRFVHKRLCSNLEDKSNE